VAESLFYLYSHVLLYSVDGFVHSIVTEKLKSESAFGFDKSNSPIVLERRQN